MTLLIKKNAVPLNTKFQIRVTKTFLYKLYSISETYLDIELIDKSIIKFLVNFSTNNFNKSKKNIRELV